MGVKADGCVCEGVCVCMRMRTHVPVCVRVCMRMRTHVSVCVCVCVRIIPAAAADTADRPAASVVDIPPKSNQHKTSYAK